MTLLPDDPPPAVEATGAIEYTESTAVTAAPGHHDGLNKAPAAAKHDNKDTAEGAVPCITADPARLSDEAQVDQPAGKDASVKSDGPANKDSGETVLATETTAQKAKKKKRGGRNGGKSIEARGPTALPKSRGTGLEGESAFFVTCWVHRVTISRVLRRPSHYAAGIRRGEGDIRLVSLLAVL